MSKHRKPHPQWEPMERGWGWTLTLTRGMTLTVAKGMCRNDGFAWQGLGVRSRLDFESADSAKISAENYARRALTRGLRALKEDIEI